MSSSTKRKGDVLEDLVALLHGGEAGTVKVRSMLPSTHTPARSREVDVLLEQRVLGLPVHTVIECKNHKEKVGIHLIDAFVGFLDDLGVPATRGIYVSPTGYTSDAMARAQDAGIKILQFDGFTSDRLGACIRDAWQSVVFLVATWTRMSRFLSCVGCQSGPGHNVELDLARHGQGVVGLMNAFWEEWVGGRLPSSPGEHVLSIRLPARFRLEMEKVADSGMVIMDVLVTAQVLAVEGEATHLSLMDVPTQATERVRIDARFPELPASVDLVGFDSEAKLQAHLKQGAVHVCTRLRVPRVVAPKCYWPPSEEALERLKERLEAGSPVEFDDIEGRNILNAWGRCSR